MTVRRIRPAAYAAAVLATGVALVPAVQLSAPTRDSAMRIICLEGGSVTAGGHTVTPPAVCVPAP